MSLLTRSYTHIKTSTGKGDPVEPNALTPAVSIERGSLLSEAPENYKRYALTDDGVSPRVLPGTPGTAFVAPSDDHDEEGNVISDVYTNPALRRKMHEKRMRKIDGVLPHLAPPELHGPEAAEVTLVGWGSTAGVIREAIDRLAGRGITANHLQAKYLVPFHAKEVTEILTGSKRVVVVENNISGQFARHLRAETGIKPEALVLKYDGEPFTPNFIADQVEAIVKGEARSLEVSEAEAREIAYHTIRIKLEDAGRPVGIERITHPDYQEPLWEVAVADRRTGEQQGTLLIGARTGATHQWLPQTTAVTAE